MVAGHCWVIQIRTVGVDGASTDCEQYLEIPQTCRMDLTSQS